MTCGVMGSKDWDEHLPKPIPYIDYIPVRYTTVAEYSQSIIITAKDLMDIRGDRVGS